MPLSLILTIILPLLSAGSIFLAALLFRPYIRYIALIAAVLTLLLALTSSYQEAGAESTLMIPLWRPSSSPELQPPMFNTLPILQSDAIARPLVLALALATCSMYLVDLGADEKASPWLTAIPLALLAAYFSTLWAANVLTTIISWAIYDLFKMIGWIAAGGSRKSAVRGLAAGSLATIFLWSGALLAEGGAGSEHWSLMTLGDAQRNLWALAGLLRMWAYPLHLALPNKPEPATFSVASLFLSPVVGWGLWLRLTVTNGGLAPSSFWVLVPAALALAVGGFLAWSSRTVRQSLPWIGMSANGLVLLAAGLAGDQALAVITAGGVTWVLGMTLLLLSDGWQRDIMWWNAFPLVGALAFAGAPPTLGFVTHSTLVERGVLESRWGWTAAFFIGQLFLVPALARRLLSPSPPGYRPAPSSVPLWQIVTRAVALGLPALLLIAAGIYPSLLSPELVSVKLTSYTLSGWLLWAASLIIGGLIAWRGKKLRSRIELWLTAAHDLLQLEWLFETVTGALERGLSLLRAADEIVGGAGALLWSWILFLLLLLIRIGPNR